ncbi:MAG: divalent metal cation transporter [Flavobacteriales bacterium]|nr:divalent metal cation transporter [Flavobacteriales bacterium]
MFRKNKNLLKTLGPGILFASTAIGVSHLVQSTRAGAEFGFGLVLVVILANLFKYPFFEFGSRYANATGKSIIDGYKKIGSWMIWTYLIITLGSMFFVSAAVGAVTSGFMDNLFSLSQMGLDPLIVTISTFFICALILFIGKFSVLDKLIKIIGSVLLISTLLAFVLTLIKGPAVSTINMFPEGIWSEDKSILFIIALMGWMPTAVDLSAWNSIWTVERIKETGYKPTLKETLFDFNFGYITSALLAFCFITLGAYMMYGTEKVMPESSALFANKVVEMYTISMGEWSYLLIASAAFSIMFGTAIAVFDGYARSMARTIELIKRNNNQLKSGTKQDEKNDSAYKLTLLALVMGSFVIVWKFGSSLKSLVDLAMTISFLIAPLIAIVNLRLVTGNHIKEQYKPKKWLIILSYMGIIFLIGFSVLYLTQQF